MKLNSKYISLIVLSFILVLVAGISFLSIEKSDVEEVYAAVPDGYVKITPNTLYENVEYYIDTTIPLGDSVNSVFLQIYPSLSVISSYQPGSGYRPAAVINSSSTSQTQITSSSGSWSSSIVDGVYPSYPVLSFNFSFVPDWLYVKQSTPSPVTQSLPITFDSGVESVSLGSHTWSSSGVSNSVVFDDEEGYYDFTVTPVADYKAVSATYTYLDDGDTNTYNVDIENNQFRLLCPVGNAITSINIVSESIYATVPLTLTWDDGIESVYSVTLDTTWTESGQSNVVTFNNPSGFCSFTPTFKDGYTYHSSSFNASSSSVTAFWNSSAEHLLFDIPVGESVSSISITSRSYLSGTFIQYAPYFTGNIVDGFEIAGYNSLGSLTDVQGGLVFNNLSEIVDYFKLNYTGDKPAGNVISVLDASYNPVSYPLTIDGQTLYLEYSAYYSTVAILGDISCVGYSQFPSATVDSDIIDLGYAYMPQYPSQSAERRIYFRHADIIYGEPTKYAKLFFDDNYYDVAIEWDINEWAYWIVLPDNLPDNYYLNTVSFTGGLLVFNFSYIPGALGWSPGIDDALDLFALIVNGTLGVLNIQIAHNMTLGTILLIVLAFGVVLFLFRISGVF